MARYFRQVRDTRGQGWGGVAGPALNCPMEVVMEFQLHPELRLSLPRARLASSGWLTFGFSRTLDEAAAIATVEMVKLMGELYGFAPRQALSLASLVVDLRITLDEHHAVAAGVDHAYPT